MLDVVDGEADTVFETVRVPVNDLVNEFENDTVGEREGEALWLNDDVGVDEKETVLELLPDPELEVVTELVDDILLVIEGDIDTVVVELGETAGEGEEDCSTAIVNPAHPTSMKPTGVFATNLTNTTVGETPRTLITSCSRNCLDILEGYPLEYVLIEGGSIGKETPL